MKQVLEFFRFYASILLQVGGVLVLIYPPLMHIDKTDMRLLVDHWPMFVAGATLFCIGSWMKNDH